MAPEKCPGCDWTNHDLMNYGTPGESRWLCHGCAALAVQGLDRLDRLAAETAELRRLTLEACRIARHLAKMASDDDVIREVDAIREKVSK